MGMNMNEWIKERRRIHDAATEGPWAVEPFVEGDQHEVKVITEANVKWDEYADGNMPDVLGYDYEEYHSTVEPRDAAFIVDAHNTLPALLDAMGRVLRVLDAGVRDGDSAELIRRVALMEIEEAIEGATK